MIGGTQEHKPTAIHTGDFVVRQKLCITPMNVGETKLKPNFVGENILEKGNLKD
jgi:hypothetical protein